ncbi:MAG: hypothetical protein R3C68_14215 [Myxococcota bacterium]
MDITRDGSSKQTGTSVFDFQGDGRAEVLYGDECFFRVYNGQTGEVFSKGRIPIAPVQSTPSCRYRRRYRSEILIGSNNDQIGRDDCVDHYGETGDLYTPAFCTCGHLLNSTSCDKEPGCAWNAGGSVCEVFNCGTLGDQASCDANPGCYYTSSCQAMPDTPAQICQQGTWGIWSIGDVQNLWVKTLPHWTQHTYHVTDVDLAGQPQADWGDGKNNWEIYNNYRQNVQGFAPLNAPDLQIFSFTANLVLCPDTVTLAARVVNRGRAGIAAGVPIDFFRFVGSTSTLITSVPLPEPLLPGQGIDISAVYAIPPADAYEPLNFSVIANPAAQGNPAFECLTDNNQANIFGVQCQQIGG